MLEQAGFAGSIITLGAVRAFGYRHGPGPFVTEDARLNGVFEERHNRANEWQGSPRYGWFDLLAVRHGMQINRQVDALALTMLDHLYRAGQLRACVSYEYLGRDFGCLEEYFETISSGGRVKITGIKPVPTGRKDTLARLLFDCVPWDWVNFDDQARSGEDFIRFLESPDGLGPPVRLVSTGPTAGDKTWRAAPGSTTEE